MIFVAAQPTSSLLFVRGFSVVEDVVNSIFQTVVVEELSAAYVPEPNARNVDATSVVVTDPTAAQASMLIDLEMFSTEHNKR